MQPFPARRVHILATGGTIAGVGAEGATGGYTPAVLPVDALLGSVPRLDGLARVSAEQYLNINSDDITQDHWLDMARRLTCLSEDPKIDGLVITHGTDTLEETAYFVNLSVKTEKPLIITGAMRPATATSADGPLNLYQAVAAAASPASAGQGALIVFGEGIYSARDARKGNTYRTHAITGGDMGPVGIMRDGFPLFYHRATRRHTKNSEFDLSQVSALPRVAIAHFHADADPGLLYHLLDGHDGLVVAGAGDGVVSRRWEEALIDLCRRGQVVVRATRVHDGAVLRDVGMPDSQIGTIACDTLSPEKARVLLMLALTRTRGAGEIQRMFDTY